MCTVYLKLTRKEVPGAPRFVNYSQIMALHGAQDAMNDRDCYQPN